EANRLKDKQISNSSSSVKANLVESAGTSKNRNKGKDKHVKDHQRKNFTPRQNDHKIQKPKGSCYVCGKPGHKAYQCKDRKDQQIPNQRLVAPQANLVEDEIIAAVVVETNLVEDKSAWIMDSGASRHFCNNKRLFHQFEEVADGEQVYMGNDGTARVIGKGKVFLKFTSGKTLALNNVLYVPSLRRNMVSGSLLVREGLKVTLEGDKVIITRNNDFVGKGYVTGGLFVLNTESSTNESSASAYIVESANMWHDLPKGCKPIKCKWIFKRKMRPDNTIEKFKARLVVVGYSQKKGIDFFDTYSPVTKVATIRSLIALASIYELVIHQMDVKTAFLNGDLEEEIYMEQPEGLVEPNKNKVCKLKKSLYGLKQAPKQWYMKFDHSLISNGFVVNASDTCVYSKVIASNCVIICLYVDDMLIFGTNINVVNETKTFLSSQFDMKDLGEVDVILGIKVRKTENGYSLCQSHYIEKVLKRFDKLFDVDPGKTPMIQQNAFSSLVSSILNWCLHFNKFPAVLEGYCDANWVSDTDETCIACSTMEAEFIALELASQEAEWLRNLLAYVLLWKKQFVPVSIHCDSQAAIGIAIMGKETHSDHAWHC
ncbi:retrovirus-related pol polyprotein from transposon TNT 1-94, partial [Tanacetum coccineum]